MTKYLIRRLIQSVPIFFLITIIVFSLINFAPGGPTGDLALFDPNIKPEDIARIRASMGLDKSVPERYLIFVGGLLHGDLGTSLIQRGVKVSDMIAERLPKTLLLTGTALLMALLIAVPLGVLSAVKQYSLLDNLATFFSTAGVAIPSFWLGLMMILLFAVNLGWFPVGGIYEVRNQTIEAGDVLWHLTLPAITLAFISIASWNRYIRASMLEVIRQDYVRTARAKGLAERLVIFRHALRNSLIPFVTLLGLSLPGLVSGALVTETIFSWAGMGRLAFTATTQRDYPLIMGVVIMASALTILGNLAADIAYGFLDPRIRYD
ncbi:MAG: ABC transporter permease [Chloroflexi bacterium]|nr:ABC transporter permease [Chloroflexota bacterium]